MRHRAITAVLIGGLVAATGLSGYAAPRAQADPPKQSAAQRAVDYWTKNNFANMRNANDAAMLASPRPTGTPAEIAPAKIVPGAQRVIRPVLSSEAATFHDPNPIGTKWTNGGKVRKTTGRVFFTIPKGQPGAGNYSCSGTVAPANNKAVVITAGHCVNDANEHWRTNSSGKVVGDKKHGVYVKNWIFVPGYDGNDKNPAPEGEFHATSLRANPHWIDNANLNYDVGMAIVGGEQGGPHKGALVANAVGSEGLGFNMPRHKNVKNFGFPAAAPYNGRVLDYSSGNALNADSNGSAKGNSSSRDDPNGSRDQVVRSNLTGGASGGPWFYSFNTSTGAGTQVSVNSFSYTGLSTAQQKKFKIPKYNMWGPYFDSNIEAMFNRAQGVSPKAATEQASTAASKSVKITLAGTRTPRPNASTPLDPDALAYQIKTEPAHGTVVRNGDVVTYTPTKGFTGTDSFSYVATNSVSNSAPATVTIKVS